MPASATNKAEREAQINRVLDQLNSPDPAARLASFEQIFPTADKQLRLMALTTAFASNDSMLRSAALWAAVASSESWIVTITGYKNKNYLAVLEKTGGSFAIYLRGANQTGRLFSVFSDYSDYEQRNGQKIYKSEEGVVAGDRVNFGLNLVYASGGDCNAILNLEKTGSKLSGTLSCNGNVYNVSTDILR